MKKLLALTLVLVIALSLVACGGSDNGNSGNSGNGNNNTSSKADNGNNDDTGTLTASVTPASGWEKDEYAPYPIYKKDGVSISLEPPKPATGFPSEVDKSSTKSIVEYLLGTLKANPSFESVNFSDVIQTEVGGMEGYGYEYTQFGVYCKTIYVSKNNTAYSVSFSGFEDDYNAAKADIQSMLDSYTLK